MTLAITTQSPHILCWARVYAQLNECICRGKFSIGLLEIPLGKGALAIKATRNENPSAPGFPVPSMLCAPWLAEDVTRKASVVRRRNAVEVSQRPWRRIVAGLSATASLMQRSLLPIGDGSVEADEPRTMFSHMVVDEQIAR